ncbi:MAG: MFS transporter [Firmicutes bacterium]|nr:MFS transporter [Bacillota bacterium]
MAKTHGIRQNLGPFLWLVVNTVFIGLAVGVERTIVPLLGHNVYHVGAVLTLSFIASFGLAKAPLNLVAGRWSDSVGRRRVLILGWVFGVPVVALLLGVHTWWAVIVANFFLGANQAFAWTMTINAQLDIAGPKQRGIAMGINEATGYIGVAVATWLAVYVTRWGGILRAPFVLEAAVVLGGLITSLFFIPDTRAYVLSETALGSIRHYDHDVRQHTAWQSFLFASFREPSLSVASWAGLTNKLADTVAWGAMPLFLAARGLSLLDIGWVSGSYAVAWGVSQFGTGALSDVWGRKRPIVLGFLLLGLGLAGITIARGMASWIALAILSGVGMALLYPNLNSAVSDLAPPDRRGSILGVYRLWRDGGYFVGGLLVGGLVAAIGARGAIDVIAALVLMMAFTLMVRLRETHLRVASTANGQARSAGQS